MSNMQEGETTLTIILNADGRTGELISKKNATPLKEPPSKSAEVQGASKVESEPGSSEEATKDKGDQFTLYRSMNFLTFTGRMGMLKNLSEIKVADNNPKQAVHLVDSTRPEFSTKTCQILKYLSEDIPDDPTELDELEKHVDQDIKEKLAREKPIVHKASGNKITITKVNGAKGIGPTIAQHLIKRPAGNNSMDAGAKKSRLNVSDPESDAAETLVALANSHRKRSVVPQHVVAKSEPSSPSAANHVSLRMWSEPGSPSLVQNIQVPVASSMVSILNNQPGTGKSCADAGEEGKKKELEFDEFANTYHSISHDTIGNPIHKCNVCSKVFTVYEAYYGHVYTHFKHRNKCFVCGKVFTRSWLLKGHMRTHTGERPYKCEFMGCDRAFADRSNLRSHMMIHQTKDKGFVCERCNRAFAQKRYLHKHQLEVCKFTSPSKSTATTVILPAGCISIPANLAADIHVSPGTGSNSVPVFVKSEVLDFKGVRSEGKKVANV